ncbi:MAG: ABC transporter ATP-binding protein [Spirochaetota bacterium]
MSDYLLEMAHITKSFGDVTANEDISLRVRKGEIRAIVGENGAGKSTLMKILNGLFQPDSGSISFKGLENTVIGNPGEAVKLGIGMVYQHFMLVPTLTVLENMILGVEPVTGLFLDTKKARTRILDVSEQYGLKVNPDVKTGKLSVGMQQRVEILKILFKGAELLIFDEPTSVLVPQEVRELYRIMENLKSEGKTIIFITHKLNEVMAIADSVTVIRDGRVVGDMPIEEASTEKMANLMVGRQVLFQLRHVNKKPEQTYVSIRNITVKDDNERVAVRGLSLDIRRGEIVGVAGVDGNGQTELVEALTGLRRIEDGTYSVGGSDMTTASPRTITRNGVAHIPEDRHKRGAVDQYDVAHNLSFGLHRDRYTKGFAGILLDVEKIYRDAASTMNRYDIRPRDSRKLFEKLSGGNQQKVVVARELEKEHDFLICAQPTRGVDIGAIESIHNMILAEKQRNNAILIVSAELSEILALSDRIAVMYEGKIAGILDRENANEDKLGILMTGGRIDE